MKVKEKNLQFIDPDEWQPGEELPLPAHISKAIRCADMSKVKIRNWRPLVTADLTDAEKSMRLIETRFRIPGGNMVGKPVRLMYFQEVIFYLMIDTRARTVLISLARRNGKTFIQACAILLQLIGFQSERNQSVGSFALTREQAGILFKQLSDMIALSPGISDLCKVVPSGKRAVSMRTGAEYVAGSGEARTNLGKSLRYLVLDEAGSIQGPDSEYTQALRTSQASYDHAVFVAISTQAPSDGDYFSVMLDTAEREQPKDTVAIVFETPKEFAIDDPEGWIYSNPGIGVFRSVDDMKAQAESAKRIPAQEIGFANLSLNRRTAMVGVWLAPSVWKSCSGKPDIEVFRSGTTVSMGLDLSQKHDLTAAVLAARDETGTVHLLPYCFTPAEGIKERGHLSRAPYEQWVKDGFLIAVPGKIISYEYVFGYLLREVTRLGISPTVIAFDTWRSEQAKIDAERAGWPFIEWSPVGQGFKSMTTRCEYFEGLLLEGRVRHGGHPLLNMAAANAIVVMDAPLNKKLDKSKSTQRIDPIVAAVMAAGVFMEEATVDVSAWVG